MELMRMAAALLALAAAPALAQLEVQFNHGVASGDPLHDAIIIWTRVTPRFLYDFDIDYDAKNSTTWKVKGKHELGSHKVHWAVSTSSDMSQPIKEGHFETDHERDFTVKVDVKGLKHSTQYYYMFALGGARSPLGKFRLPPPEGTSLDTVRYGVYTCSSWGWGYFNAYDYGAQLDLDFWMHMGDYIYEYGIDTYPTPEEAVRYDAFPGGLQPPHEIVSLEDYRARYALYRTDPGLQRLHASAPMIAIWDDHEHTNDPWADGAENHQPETEGDWEARKERSVRVWHEWMPMRGGTYGESDYAGEEIWRSFAMGDLLKVVALEGRLDRTRQYPEDAPFQAGPTAAIIEILGSTPPHKWSEEQIEKLRALRGALEKVRQREDRELIGKEQLAFVEKESGSGQTWTAVAQTTNVADIGADYEKAVRYAKKHMPAVASLWKEALKNVTTAGRHARSYSTSPHELHKLGDFEEMAEDAVVPNIAAVAAGRYDIITWFDPWGAHPVERERFFKALQPAGGNAVVYSGDTHAAYAAMMRAEDGSYVGAEYSAPGVSSPSSERGSRVPLELHNAAALVAKHSWKDVRYKGFQYVTVTHDKHHVDFVNVPWGTTNYQVSCDYAFDLHSAGEEEKPMAEHHGPVGTRYGIPVDTLEDLLNPAGADATRSVRFIHIGHYGAMRVVPCSDLPRARPYGVDAIGITDTTGPSYIVENINRIAVY